ncbi:putative secreted protein (Por secretion system target) [Tenacibaculum adriaticum]|uniref:Putative secreted protein (Por secretion system target) n=1 Tax=Tenacibaculum adriaticum TaxID=413713 RepID=A0A5S5DWZ0_9FLAO|nr:RICIN domain-containing protein [Tenacibaculum adriaticum]TYP99302.1 putative secreted protein (Por secretion system target) [Tenacibaculum adriaticum]
MKKRIYTSLVVIIAFCNFAMSQTSLGSSKSFLADLKENIANNSARGVETDILLKVSDEKSLNGKINFQKTDSSNEYFINGEIKNTNGSFYINVTNKSLEGNIILKATNEAYKYYSDKEGNAFIESVDINSLLCVNYNNIPEKDKEKSTNNVAERQIAQALLNLQSLPGAAGCILLDFDGYYMPAGNLWNNGNDINAAGSGMSDADIQQHWEVVAEDYRPFNLNVTTNEAVFNSYPRNRRMRVVVTPTNTAAPGAGGVAYIGSFNWDNDVPCWVFITSGKSGGDASSHEIGHTFDLGHDGRTNPDEGYFLGIDGTSWAPIMGAGYYRSVVQWSKGEYNYANNLQDDVATIAGSKFGVGYRGDDYSDGISGAANLDYNNNGTINQKNGVISSEADYDFFTFTTGGGNVSINANTVGRDGNLHLLIRLYNASGIEIGTYWNSDPFALNASMNVNLTAGKYFIGVDGTGAGNAGYGGYSAYGSIGSYSVTGTIPPGGNINSSTGLVTVYKDCNYTGFSGGLEIGDYNLARLNSLGVLNDDISSIRIIEGYKVILYQDDNFTGGSVVLGGDLSCFDTTWNDKVSSVRVLANGDPNVTGTYYLQNRNSGLNMDVWGASQNNGTNIAQGTPNSGANQKYTFTHLGDGLYKIIANHSGQSLDINNFNKANGANLEQYPYNGTTNQQFIAVSTGDGYYKLIAKHSGKIVEVTNASTANGANIQQWDNNNQTCGQWKLLPATSSQISTLIQAEDYSSMSGIETETTTDIDGGLNVAYADTGDWMAYNDINFSTSGSYLIEYRVASEVDGAVISSDLNGGTIVLGNVAIPNTSGWQNWQTVSQTVNINAGTYNFGIYIQNTGVNINWIRITKIGAAVSTIDVASSTIQDHSIELITMYPNPAESTLNFSSEIEGTQISIFNSTGILVANRKMNRNTLNVSDLKSGIYVIVFEKNGKNTVKKFIKK